MTMKCPRCGLDTVASYESKSIRYQRCVPCDCYYDEQQGETQSQIIERQQQRIEELERELQKAKRSRSVRFVDIDENYKIENERLQKRLERAEGLLMLAPQQTQYSVNSFMQKVNAYFTERAEARHEEK